MTHPLSSVRYTRLADTLPQLLHLLNRYLELRIQILEGEINDRKDKTNDK